LTDIEKRSDRRDWRSWVRAVLTQSLLFLLAAVTVSGFASWTQGVVDWNGSPAVTRVEGMPHTRLRVERATEVLTYASQYRIPADLSAAIYDIARDEGIHPALAFQLVKVESGFRLDARSARGAIGYTQLRVSTARGYDPAISETALADRETNLRLGFRFLKDLLDRFDNNLPIALLAYNRGPTLVDSLLTMGQDPSNGYSEAVMRGLKRSVREAPQDLRRGS
jgi:soluble lytic murein transglycosylase-like protein